MRVVLVGNAPMQTNHSTRIDSATMVVRCNEPKDWGARSGTRFDRWIIDNGRGARKFIRTSCFAGKPYANLPTEVWFPRVTAVHDAIRERAPDGPFM
jgi:hypothetical protein